MLSKRGLESFQLDVDYTSSIRNAMKEIQKRTKRLDALFNNAGYSQVGAVEDIPRDAMRAQFETNVFGALELANAVIPLMRKQKSGRIIWNSSILGLVAMPMRGIYNASKFAMEGLVDTLRLELEGSGIQVSLIEPGPVRSKVRKNALPIFRRTIDKKNSVYQQTYRELEEKLKEEGPVAPFTLGPEAVLKKLIHALESPNPKARYYVTFPTYLFGFLRKVLPIRVLDFLLKRV